jgi:hypothetical protein
VNNSDKFVHLCITTAAPSVTLQKNRKSFSSASPFLRNPLIHSDKRRHCRHSRLFAITNGIASTSLATCLFIDPGPLLCATLLLPVIRNKTSLSPVIGSHATTTVTQPSCDSHDHRNPYKNDSLRYLMPSQHGFQFQLVAADGRCGFLQDGPRDAHHSSQ